MNFDDAFLRFFRDDSLHLFLSKKGFSSGHHSLFIGLREMFHWLDAEENIYISFFSNGLTWRNKRLIKLIMIYIFGEEKGLELYKKLIIISRGDEKRIAPEIREILKESENGLLAFKRVLKDISIFSRPENNFNIQPFNQFHNLTRKRIELYELKTSGASQETITEKEQEVDRIIRRNEEPRLPNAPIINSGVTKKFRDFFGVPIVDYDAANKNAVLVDDNKYAIAVVPDGEKQFLHCPTDRKATEAFKRLLDFQGDEDDFKRSDLYAKVNNIFYITGCLHLAINQARETNEPLSEIVTELQADSDFTEQRLVDHGLEVLRQYNPDLQLVCPEYLNDDLDIVNGNLERLFRM